MEKLGISNIKESGRSTLYTHKKVGENIGRTKKEVEALLQEELEEAKYKNSLKEWNHDSFRKLVNISMSDKFLSLENFINYTGDIFVKDKDLEDLMTDYIELDASVDVRGCPNLKKFPKNVSVFGDFNASGLDKVANFFESVAVAGTLDLTSCNALMLQKEEILKVIFEGLNSGSIGSIVLDAWAVKYEDLPNKIELDGNISMRSCLLLESFPLVNTEGDIMLSDCNKLETLTNNSIIEGDLFLDGCTSLVALPIGLKVGGDIVLSKDVDPRVIKHARLMKQHNMLGGKVIVVED